MRNHRKSKSKKDKPEKPKDRIFMFMIICAIVIAYPFFTISYFESHTALTIAAKFFLIPIFITLLIVFPKYYMRHMKPSGKKRTSKFEDNFSIGFLTVFITGIFYWMSFSLIITTNKWFDTSEPVRITERVTLYYPNITKHGKLRHYIQFTNPETGENIELEVYRRYEAGELFEKEMNYGAWGILYADK